MYYLFWFAAVIVPRIPAHWLAALSWFFGGIAWVVAAPARRNAQANIDQVLRWKGEERIGKRQRRRMVRSMFRVNARNYLEMFHMPGTTPDMIRRTMLVEGKEHLDAAHALGRGVIIFTGHFGPYDYMIQWLIMQGYEGLIPVESLKNQRLLDLVTRLRSSKGLEIVPLDGSNSLKRLLAGLKKNKVMVLTADRVFPGQQGQEMDLFGEKTLLPVGVASLAKRTGAAVVGAFGWWADGQHVHGQLFPVSLQLSEEERRDTVCLQKEIVRGLETYIGARPEQWIAFSPIWSREAIKINQAKKQ